MKIYIKKVGKSFEILKETTTQSILSDAVTSLVIVTLFAADIVFSKLVMHSFIIDFFVCFVLISYILNCFRNRKKEVKTKEDLHKIIDELF
jgi:hypothetical protein